MQLWTDITSMQFRRKAVATAGHCVGCGYCQPVLTSTSECTSSTRLNFLGRYAIAVDVPEVGNTPQTLLQCVVF